MDKLITLKTIRDEKELLRNIKANCSKAPDIAIELQQYTPDLEGYTIYIKVLE